MYPPSILNTQIRACPSNLRINPQQSVPEISMENVRELQSVTGQLIKTPEHLSLLPT
jgi:hypothetical protein